MTPTELSSAFTIWDWLVVALYMTFTTWLGHKLSGKQSSIRDFFLGGRKLPWWAVSGSIIATEISALTFIGVPGGVYAMQGDWTYLQWGIGSIIARFIVGYYLVPLYYKKEIYSPYDFMGDRLGEGVRRLVTGLFSLGAILGQSVRVLVTALILQIVTGLDAPTCIIIIGAFAIGWAMMGGMQTVIWTDAIQFCLFLFGGLFAFGWLYSTLGWDTITQHNLISIEGEPYNKMNALDFRSPMEHPAVGFTFWLGVFIMPFQNVAAFGVDQLSAQRMFCCKSEHDARKAICWSSISIFITLLMLAVGSGLFAWYIENPPNEETAALFAKDKNFVFPLWITTVLPVGLSGLILAGAFAAAISSLDSILAALSQTSLSIIIGREAMEEEAGSKRMVKLSRIGVFIWGIILSAFSILMWKIYDTNPDEKNLIDLAFGIIAYTFGPLLGILLAALIKQKTNFGGLLSGAIISILFVSLFRNELPSLLVLVDLKDGDAWKAIGKPTLISEWFFENGKVLHSVWFYPINATITLLFGLIGGMITKKRNT